jgi:hypothetical protein
MRFNGCGCRACKAVAVGAAGLFFANYVYPTAYSDECWHRSEVRLYCQSVLPEQPHGPETDQRPINWVRGLVTVASSTSSSAATVNPDFSFKPSR